MKIRLCLEILATPHSSLNATSKIYVLSSEINKYALKWNEIDFKVQEAKKANGTESTSRWFQTY